MIYRKNTALTEAHLNKALDDKDYMVRHTAITHPDATPYLITKALDDKDERIRIIAIKHPNATSYHIDKALNDESNLVRMAAIEMQLENLT